MYENDNRYPITIVTGFLGSGKTTLAKAVFQDLPYVTLEDPDMRLAAKSDPRYFLEQHRSGAILDEIQNVPELMSYLQGVIDGNPDAMGRFILTGSRQFALMEAMTQSLARVLRAPYP